MTSRAVVSLSGGVGSWAAAVRALETYEHVDLLFADTMIEDEDLYRFLGDVERQLGQPIIRVADGRNPWQVFFDHRFVGNTRIDPCSRVLKRELLHRWVTDHYPNGVDVVIGIDWTEEHRTIRIRENYQPHRAVFPLIEDAVDKCDMLVELDAAGIDRPRLYEMGFPHNNCGGFCIKAGQAQFARLLHFNRDRYLFHEMWEQRLRCYLGKDVAILRDRREVECAPFWVHRDARRGGYWKTTRPNTRPLTLREFRGMVERGEKYDRTEWGGCGCATDDGTGPSQLTLDIFAATPVNITPRGAIA